MQVKLKKDVKPFRIHNGKEWIKIKDNIEIDEVTFNAIKDKVEKIKIVKPKEAKK